MYFRWNIAYTYKHFKGKGELYESFVVVVLFCSFLVLCFLYFSEIIFATIAVKGREREERREGEHFEDDSNIYNLTSAQKLNGGTFHK